MNNFFFLFSFLAVNLICNAQTYIGVEIHDSDKQRIVSCLYGTSPIADGDLGDWQDNKYYEINHINSYTKGETLQDKSNFNMKYSTKHDKEFLYFSFIVEDDHLGDRDNVNFLFDPDFDSIRNERSKEGFSCYFFAAGGKTSSNNDILNKITYVSSWDKNDNWRGEISIPLNAFDKKNGSEEEGITVGDNIQFNIGYEDFDPNRELVCYGLVRAEWGWGSNINRYYHWALLRLEHKKAKIEGTWQFLEAIF